MAIRARCYNPKHRAYCNYGKRGIIICDEWLNNPERFCEWAMSNGYKQELTIDRKDNDGNYEPDNCRFVTRKIQSRNTRQVHKLIYKGELLTIVEIVERYNINRCTLTGRIAHGWSVKEAIDTPLKHKYYGNDNTKKVIGTNG